MSSIYHKSMSALDKVVPSKFQPLWQHPAGPKTIFFWAPAFKWGLVIAGIGDLTRPVEKLSVPQSAALAATGLIWSRYSLVIIPKNYSLFSVNVFRGCNAMLSTVSSYKLSNETKKRIVTIVGRCNCC